MKLIKTHLSRPLNVWSKPIVSFVLLLMFGLSTLLWRSSPLTQNLIAEHDFVFKEHHYFTLFSSLFLHADLKHFLSNSIFFFIFGFFLHSYFGFLVFPVLSFFAGILINALTLSHYEPHQSLIGASGMVYFMAAFWATLYAFIERKQPFIKRGMAVLGVSLMLFFPGTYEPDTSYLAHGYGFLLGLISGTVYFILHLKKIRASEVWERIEDHEMGVLLEETPENNQIRH